MREAAVEEKLINGVRRLGFEAYKFVSPGNAGVPDRIIMGHGLTIFAELKTDTGRPSPIQEVQIRKLKKLGQEVRILYGAKDVKAFLQELSEARALNGGGDAL